MNLRKLLPTIIGAAMLGNGVALGYYVNADRTKAWLLCKAVGGAGR